MEEHIDPHEAAKQQKKAAKAQAKLAKKQAKSGAILSVPTASFPAGDSTPSPAHRSAEAAEKQVKLQSLRVKISLLAALIALATLIATVRPWRLFEAPGPSGESPPPVQPERD